MNKKINNILQITIDYAKLYGVSSDNVRFENDNVIISNIYGQKFEKIILKFYDCGSFEKDIYLDADGNIIPWNGL